MSQTTKRNDSNPLADIVPSDEEERYPCCPLDPPERAEPNQTPLPERPRQMRSPQSQREFYQNEFPVEP